MSVYHEILELARQQSAAVVRGDLETAVRLVGDRGAVLRDAPPAGPGDADAIREILRRDRDLAGAIRERMIEIRNQAVSFQRGRVALSGYTTRLHSTHHLVDTKR
jgi:hypothetical protein